MRIVLDTNVLVSGFFFGGVPGRILSAWRSGSVALVVSPPIIAEYQSVGAILEARYGGREFGAFASLLLLGSEIVDAPEHLRPPACSDEADDKFLACAAAASVEVIVSGDAALLAVTGWRGIRILKPRTFVDECLGRD